jgi:predicted flavoprotein YhiN
MTAFLSLLLGSAQSISAPIAMELKQTITLRVDAMPMHKTASFMDNQMKKEAEAALAIAGGSIFGKDAAPVKVEVRFLLTRSTRDVASSRCVCDFKHHPEIMLSLLHQAPPRIEAVVPMAKGFMIVGGMGFIAVYERIDDKVYLTSTSFPFVHQAVAYNLHPPYPLPQLCAA